MRKSGAMVLWKLVGAVLGIVLFAATGHLQAEDRASPHEKVSAMIAGKALTIEYGRRSKKGRKIFGELVPLKAVWRAGADEATTFTTEVDLTVGTLKVPKGSYSLFVIPNDKEWTLIVNKEPKQWGAYKYDQAKDLGRTPMKISTVKEITEKFTISVDAKGSKGQLKLAWDTTTATVDLSSP